MFDLIPFEHRSGSLFDNFDKMVGSSFFGGSDKYFTPCRTDIIDDGDRYVLKADMPGFDKSEISIDADGNRLSIAAEHKEENRNEENDYVRCERHCSAFGRSFDIEGIDSGKISASYKNGVLELSLPKLVEAKPEVKKIQIS